MKELEYYDCDCTKHVLRLYHDIEHLNVELALFEPMDINTKTFFQRLRLAWAALKGTLYTDNFIFNYRAFDTFKKNIDEIHKQARLRSDEVLGNIYEDPELFEEDGVDGITEKNLLDCMTTNEMTPEQQKEEAEFTKKLFTNEMKDQLELLAMQLPGFALEHLPNEGFVVHNDNGDIIGRSETAQIAMKIAVDYTQEEL